MGLDRTTELGQGGAGIPGHVFLTLTPSSPPGCPLPHPRSLSSLGMRNTGGLPWPPSGSNVGEKSQLVFQGSKNFHLCPQGVTQPPEGDEGVNVDQTSKFSPAPSQKTQQR